MAKVLPRVLVEIPTANFLFRKILEGVLEYARRKGPWNFRLVLAEDDAGSAGTYQKWKATAAIVLTDNPKTVQRVAMMETPTVFINPPECATLRRLQPHVTAASYDHEAAGRAVAEYFLSRKYRNFAWLPGRVETAGATGRRKGFLSALAKAGFKPAEFGYGSSLEDWLASLPKPCALFALHDRLARQVVATAAEIGVMVPNDIAVMGVDNDEVLCETATPTLSTVDLNGRMMGFRCAHLLDRLMCGKPTQRRAKIGFLQIVTRQSTDASAISDPVVTKVLAHVRENLSASLSVAKLARKGGCSERTLQLKFGKVLGHSLREEVFRQRVYAARDMIVNTGKTIAEIAYECGFCSQSHLGRRVKDVFGKSPRQMRNEI